MSLGIFSFDLAALINSLSDFIEISEPEILGAENPESLEKTAEVLQNSAVSQAILDDVLMAAALNSTITSIITTERAKKETAAPPAKPLVRAASGTLDEETRREIEQLIKSLQTSVIYNYRSSDIIDETVSLNRVTNFPNREIPEDTETNIEKLREERERELRKLETLREELKRAMLKNSSDV